MNELIERKTLPAMSQESIDKVGDLDALIRKLPQVSIATYHVLHAGLYARTITIPKGVVLSGVLIKIPTLVIVEGNASVWLGDSELHVTGYNVIPASAHRKQAYIAHTDVNITMVFPTKAKDIRVAEQEFTDETDLLFSRSGENVITITRE